MGVNEILGKLRQLADSNREQGDLFECVIANYLRESPLYRDRIAEAWQWGEWTRRKGIDQTDVGIDLVVRTHENEYWAVQCKCYAEEHYLQKADIDSFLATAGQSWGGVRFSLCLIIATTSRWSKHAEEALERRQPPCIRLGLAELAADEGVNWSALLPGMRQGVEKPARRRLRPHQIQAVDDVIAGFQKSDRGQLIMACGTGKTFTALKIAEQQIGAGGRVLFLVPSLALLSQILREWSAHHEWEFMRSFAVCSDRKVGRDNEDISAYDLVIPPTTDGRRLASSLKWPLPKGWKRTVQVVFATYHSIGVVHTAQKFGAGEFDLVICDEAHRTTGVELQGEEASYYTRVHDNDYLRAGKRLYMTATPRIYSETARQRAREQDVQVFSMDAAAKYGAEFHRLDFSDAVAKDLLSDYKVLILAINEAYASRSVQGLLATNGEVNLDDAAKIIGCWNGLSKRIDKAEAADIADMTPMRRAVAFNQSIKASKQVAGHFSSIVEEYRQGNPDDITALECEIKHVDGTQNALVRNQALQWLRDEPEDNSCRILSNVRCLSEGVDVPALDAVMFLNPRRSQVDVVQSVGRVMRKAEGKNEGYIILPICVDADSAPEDALSKNAKYQVVWNVLQALRAHDNLFNAEINKIELNKQPSKRINVIGVGFGSGTEQNSGTDQNTISDVESVPYLHSQRSIPLALEEWRNALLARIVLKCGDRRYWENWAKDVADIAGRNIARINTLVAGSEAGYRELFEEFMLELRQNLNPAVTEEDAIEMLAQHLITRPVFDALFKNYSFIGNNPVSKTMQAMLELLDEKNLETEAASLEGFYESVRQRASGIDNAEGRQKVIVELYEKFFKTAFPKMAKSLGIVYTPVEVVDFILDSTDALLKQEFGKGLTAENVHILDPFIGTGTFMTRLLRSQHLIGDEDLERKYRKELHANEIVLLAYYIAAVNIEETYHGRLAGKRRQMGQDDTVDYEPFEGITLTDTFQINEHDGSMLEQIFPVNSKRVLRQKDTPIRVVMGNPPYSVGRRNAKLRYPKLDGSIAGSYAEHSTAQNKRSLYDSYIRAFRWASDRIGEEGIIAHVSNSGWLDGNAMDGFRRCLAEEFDRIYCFNLRGNAQTSGEQRRKEKDNVFGEGTKTNIAVLFLVKKQGSEGSCQIYYHDIGDYLSRQQKLEIIKKFGNVKNMDWRTITPNAHHDWINHRGEAFLNYLLLGDKDRKENKGTAPTVFTLYSGGVKTNRDPWVYNFSKKVLTENMQKTIAFYNSEVERYRQACEEKVGDERPDVADFIHDDSTQIHWADLTGQVEKNKTSLFSRKNLRHGIYRPFCKQWLYFDARWNTRRYQQPGMFPKPDTQNLAICVSGISSSKEFSALMVNMTPDLEVVSKSQCFPRYRYTSAQGLRRQAVLELTEPELTRLDNIPADTVSLFQSRHRNKGIDADSIFYYVYGILHSLEYKARYSAELKKMLPRIPYANSFTDFQSFSEAGKQLAELHVGYEDVEPWPVVIREDGAGTDGKDHYQVRKMRFGGSSRQPDKSVIRYNPRITIENIPLTAYDYVVNGKSAIDWIMERYQVTTHKDSGITNDPNDWSDDPRYILDLLQKVVRVSMDTVRIVEGLPTLEPDTDSTSKKRKTEV